MSGSRSTPVAEMPAVKLLVLFQRERPPSVDVVGQILEMDALGAFLAVLHANERDCDLSGRYLSDELLWREVSEIIPAHKFYRNDSSAIILRHEKESGVHVQTHLVHHVNVVLRRRDLEFLRSPSGSIGDGA